MLFVCMFQVQPLGAKGGAGAPGGRPPRPSEQAGGSCAARYRGEDHAKVGGGYGRGAGPSGADPGVMV